MSAPRKRTDVAGGALGVGQNYRWRATETDVGMAVPIPLRIPCEPQSITVDPNRTAIIAALCARACRWQGR